jgi:Mn2+/Fe2+ NRAMP family transporter
VLFWSVIAAAFIGPGTVTTAASAGASFGLSLAWALVFSTVACLVLQEAAARLTVVSGRDLAGALRERTSSRLGRGAVYVLAGGGILLGCAAYEAGNILGGVAGASLGLGGSRTLLTLILGASAAALLWLGAPAVVARVLAAAVAVMGVAFLVTAVSLAPDLGELLVGSFVPRAPEGSGWLVLGLLGTTVVPYNLFLGSGIAAGERLDEMRFGLSVAVVLGGIISLGILVVGTAVSGELTFPALAAVLAERLGGWAATLFGAGLLAAGFSSAVTAPLAAAVTLRGLAASREDPAWGPRSLRFRAVWGGVLLVGIVFGVLDVRPIPAILLAQALNGLLLPLAAVFLLVAINDRELMGERVNGAVANAVAALVVGVSVLLGLRQVLSAAAKTFDLPVADGRTVYALALVTAAGLAWPVGRWILAGRAR